MRSEGDSRTGWGREFQSRGAVREKALSPKDLSFDLGNVRERVEEDLTGGAVGDEEVRQVGGGRWWRALKVRRSVLKMMRCLMGSQWREWRMGVMCSRDWVWVRRRAAEFWTSCPSMEGMRGDASEEGVAVVETGGDEGVDEGFSSRGREAVSDFGDAAEVEVGGLDDGADVGIEG